MKRKLSKVPLYEYVAGFVADQLNDLGLSLPVRPDIPPPEFPEDLTDMDDRGLMSIFWELQQWHSYAATQFSVAEAEEFAIERWLRQAETVAVLRAKSKTVTAAKAECYEDTDYVQAQHDLVYAYARRKLLANMALFYERQVALVSRELTRRSNISPVEDRVSRRWQRS